MGWRMITGRDGRSHGRAAGTSPRSRQKVSEVIREKITERRKRCKPREPGEPADLESDERSERRARVKIQAARLLETAAYLGKAQNGEKDRHGAHHVRQEAVWAGQSKGARGESEDTASDDGVQDERDEILLANLSEKTACGCCFRS